ncbi:arginase family protein [Paractinoplanes atraurantiacus]|uniref:Arginase n=1 Tax=Paractinoplanes atraurantiacus TaxID=1036182 RepID=A0A285J493_9ACTN|nr:arginase family protein [Actinoplanes atraurantiacus]SNY55032.1 arginase [Actinoplanes atraurantiacus]
MSDTTLRLLWPQWQGAGTSSVRELAPEFPFDVARRGYAVGSAVLEAVLPAHEGPTDSVPVAMNDFGLDLRDGIEAKEAVIAQLAAAFDVIRRHDADRIVTLGGECEVSVAPFAALAERYGDDLANVWIDSHPDIGTPSSAYPGFHAMAVSALTGHGDPGILRLLPATVDPARVTLAGLHAWTDDDIGNVADRGIRSFAPDDLRTTSQPLLDWLAATGCSRAAVHFDVDTVDGDEIVFGLGAEPGGLTTTQVRRIIADLHATTDVVGLTIAEFIRRQVIHLQQLLRGFPLLGP